MDSHRESIKNLEVGISKQWYEIGSYNFNILQMSASTYLSMDLFLRERSCSPQSEVMKFGCTLIVMVVMTIFIYLADRCRSIGEMF